MNATERAFEIFKVVGNGCNCHPETCCCDDYAIVNVKTKEKHSTYFREETAEEVCGLLNNREKLDDN